MAAMMTATRLANSEIHTLFLRNQVGAGEIYLEEVAEALNKYISIQLTAVIKGIF
jgi:hypothetical protein